MTIGMPQNITVINDRTPEKTFDAMTNAEKHVTSNNACAVCQRYTDD